jgi:hypothetical protein
VVFDNGSEGRVNVVLWIHPDEWHVELKQAGEFQVLWFWMELL